MQQYIEDLFLIEAAVLHPEPTTRCAARQELRERHGLTDEGKAYYRYVVQLRKCGWRGPIVTPEGDH